ncbi:MAG: OadG family protein [Anaerolineales bacterium]|nr:OadG family protein [Anaerolineales bacterium]
MNDISTGLLITGIGMGLVFAVIILLWGLMALLVRVTSPNRKADLPGQIELEPAGNETDLSLSLDKYKAAAAAVAYAINLRSGHLPGKLDASPTNLSSNWQAAARTRLINNQNNRGRRS